MDEVVSLVNECAALIGKPKIFIADACQSITGTTSQPQALYTGSAAQVDEAVAKIKDTLIATAASTGTYAYSNSATFVLAEQIKKKPSMELTTIIANHMNSHLTHQQAQLAFNSLGGRQLILGPE